MASLSSGQTAFYTGTPPAAYYYVNNSAINYGLYQRVGSTNNQVGYAGGNVTYSAVPTALRSLWYFQIEKLLTTQLIVTVWVPNTTQVLINSTRGDYLKGLENEGGPATPQPSPLTAAACHLPRGRTTMFTLAGVAPFLPRAFTISASFGFTDYGLHR